MINAIVYGVVSVAVLAWLLNITGILSRVFGPDFLPDLVRNGSQAIRGG